MENLIEDDRFDVFGSEHRFVSRQLAQIIELIIELEFIRIDHMSEEEFQQHDQRSGKTGDRHSGEHADGKFLFGERPVADRGSGVLIDEQILAYHQEHVIDFGNGFIQPGERFMQRPPLLIHLLEFRLIFSHQTEPFPAVGDLTVQHPYFILFGIQFRQQRFLFGAQFFRLRDHGIVKRFDPFRMQEFIHPGLHAFPS